MGRRSLDTPPPPPTEVSPLPESDPLPGLTSKLQKLGINLHTSNINFRMELSMPGFIFVFTIFCPKWKMVTFSPAHSHVLTNATRRHEYFRGLSRLLPVPGVLVSFLELRFLGKMALLALGGRPQPLKKFSQSQKGHFYENKCAK